MLLTLLLLPHLWTTWIALASRSQTAWALGRYSRALLLFNLLNLCALLLTTVATVRAAYRLALIGLSALVVLTYATGMNNELASARFFLPVVLASRLGLAGLFVFFAYAAHTARDARAARLLLVLGAVIATVAVVDAVALNLLQRVNPAATGGFSFRSPVDLGRIGPNAIVVVGDSFVYGVGVSADEAFPTVLGRKLGRPVHNLGLGGTGLAEYRAVIERIAACDTAVVCFYMNDIRSRETPAMRVRQLLVATGRTSAVLKLAADLAGVRMYPGARAYTSWVVSDYDARDPSYSLRWHKLTEDLAAVAGEAGRASRRKPILVLFPLMYDFRRYPLTQVHSDLSQLGGRLGFVVVDMLPIFSAAFPDGTRFVAGPDDTHFNAQVHAKVAEVLKGLLTGTSDDTSAAALQP